jgi:release factor glutamine methyltransferase
LVKTYSQLYLDARRTILLVDDSQSAAMVARQLLCFVSGKTQEQILADRDLYASEDISAKLDFAVSRYVKGEPLAYILGEWEFYGLPLDISEDVLIPRADTEVLAEHAIAYCQTLPECRVLDLCAGSGCIGLAVASQVPKARVILGEYSDAALKICRQNIRRNGLSGRVLPVQVDAREVPERALGEFDCIVSNPPYIPRADIAGLDTSVKDYEPLMALDGGEDGLDFYRTICRDWRDVMHPGTGLFFEVGIGQADDVLRIMREVGFGDIQVAEDSAGIPRVVYGKLCESV